MEIEARHIVSTKVLPQDPASADPKCKSDALNQRLGKDGSFFAQFCDKIEYVPNELNFSLPAHMTLFSGERYVSLTSPSVDSGL